LSRLRPPLRSPCWSSRPWRGTSSAWGRLKLQSSSTSTLSSSSRDTCRTWSNWCADCRCRCRWDRECSPPPTRRRRRSWLTACRHSASMSVAPSTRKPILHRHALESLLAFLDLRDLAAALSVCRDWRAAVGSMRGAAAVPFALPPPDVHADSSLLRHEAAVGSSSRCQSGRGHQRGAQPGPGGALSAAAAVAVLQSSLRSPRRIGRRCTSPPRCAISTWR